MRADVLGEARQRREDAHVVLVVGAQLEAVALRDDERDLEDVDRVEAEAFAVERRLGVDRSGAMSRFSASTRSAATSLCRGVWAKVIRARERRGKSRSSLSKRCLRAPHSTRAPEALTSGSYLASSALTNAANRSGDIGIGSA